MSTVICPRCREPVPALSYHASGCTGPAPEGSHDLVAQYGVSTRVITSSVSTGSAPA